MKYLFCYDICEDRRLRRVAKVLEAYGIRVQYSFFNIDLSQDMLKLLIQKLLEIINEKEDKLFIYPICSECKRNVIIEGSGEFLSLEHFIIV